MQTLNVDMTGGVARRTPALPLLLAFYLAAPLYPIPLINVSLSFPVIVILVLQIQRRTGQLPLPRHSRLTAFLVCLLVAMIISLVANVLSGDLVEGYADSLKAVAQFGFYIVCAGLGYRLFCQPSFPASAATAFAIGVAVMSLFVIVEQLLFGGYEWGWSNLTRMSQNGYAVQYSAFLPFMYCALVASKRLGARLCWGLLVAFSLGAVLINSSRTAWGTTVLTLCVFIAIYAVVRRRYIAALIAALVIPVVLLGTWLVLPDRVRDSVEKDFDTFDNLQGDKSWMIRQLQIQKSMKIFAEKPLIGVGPAQFRNQLVALEMPDVLAGRNARQFSDVSAHNSYIQALSEGGLIFMTPFVAMLAWLLLAGARAAVVLCRRGEVWALGLFAGMIGLSVHFWTIAALMNTSTWFLYGGVAAMIFRARQVKSYARRHSPVLAATR
jgi:O-antigen ligase